MRLRDYAIKRSYRVNLNVIGLDGRPRVRNLRDLLIEWLEYSVEVERHCVIASIGFWSIAQARRLFDRLLDIDK